MKRKIGKILMITASILLTLIVFLFVIIIISSEFIFGKRYGPYHHEAIITIPTKVVTVGNKQYTWFDRTIYHIEGNDFLLFSRSSDSRNIIGINDITTDGEDLIVAAWDANSGLTVFSSDCVYKETLVTGSVRSALVNGDKIYYFRANNSGEYFELRCYDRALKTDEFVAEKFSNDTVTVDGFTIYANYKGNLYSAEDIEKVNQANDYLLNDTEKHGITCAAQKRLGFYYNGATGEVNTENGRITLDYGGESFGLDNEDNCYLYNRIVVNGNKLYFAVMDYKSNDNCIYDFCICHVEKSRLVSFDFETKTFTTEKNLDENEYFISFGEGFTSYYSNGKVYRDGVVVTSVNEIKPQGEFMQYGTINRGGETKISRSVFYDTGTELYYRFDENTVKNEY